LVWHLRACNNLVMESSKPKHPSTQKEGLRHRDHVAMYARVLSNPLARYREHKAIARARRHINPEWDRLQVVLQDTLEVLNPTFIKLASSHTF
jgi:hypothetical protein